MLHASWHRCLTQTSALAIAQHISKMACAGVQEKELSMTGRNWGEAIIDGSTLVFNVAGKPALRIPLTDVGQV